MVPLPVCLCPEPVYPFDDAESTPDCCTEGTPDVNENEWLWVVEPPVLPLVDNPLGNLVSIAEKRVHPSGGNVAESINIMVPSGRVADEFGEANI